jgi:hypothetical protein
MNPIFDDIDYAEKLLKNGFVTFMSMRDLRVLAKYYRYQGHDESQLILDLQEFCKKFNPQYNEILAEEKIERAIAYSKSGSIKLPIIIEVTKAELDRIKQVNNYKYEKILFCMLFIAKYNRKIKETNDPEENFNGKYYVNGKFAPCLAMAKVYATKVVQDEIKADLKVLGYFNATNNAPKRKYKNEDGGFELFYLDREWNEEDVAVRIEDLNNVISSYPIYCEICGKELKNKARYHAKCNDCYHRELKDRENERKKILHRKRRETTQFYL